MQEINIFIFQSINNLSSIDSIAFVASLASDIPIFFIPLFLIWMWIYYSFSSQYTIKKIDSKKNLLFIFYSCVVAIITSMVIQQFVTIERPETAISGMGKLLLAHIPDASFPSDHASVSVAFLTALFISGYKKIFYFFLPLSILMLVSRIIVGVHWPLDILAGIGVGIFGALISMKYLSQIKFVKKVNLFIIHILSYLKL